MKTKRLRGGQSNNFYHDITEIFIKYIMLPIICIGIIKDFATGKAEVGGVLLFFLLFFMFILYLTTLGADYINNPNGYTIIKVILGVLMLFNTGAIFMSVIGLLVILLIVLSGLFS